MIGVQALRESGELPGVAATFGVSQEGPEAEKGIAVTPRYNTSRRAGVPETRSVAKTTEMIP